MRNICSLFTITTAEITTYFMLIIEAYHYLNTFDDSWLELLLELEYHIRELLACIINPTTNAPFHQVFSLLFKTAHNYTTSLEQSHPMPNIDLLNIRRIMENLFEMHKSLNTPITNYLKSELPKEVFDPILERWQRKQGQFKEHTLQGLQELEELEELDRLETRI